MGLIDRLLHPNNSFQFSDDAKRFFAAISEISKVGLDSTAQRRTTEQIEWIDMTGIVGLMKRAQPTSYELKRRASASILPLARTVAPIYLPNVYRGT